MLVTSGLAVASLLLVGCASGNGVTNTAAGSSGPAAAVETSSSVPPPSGSAPTAPVSGGSPTGNVQSQRGTTTDRVYSTKRCEATSGSGFELSLPAGQKGWPTPLRAAQAFGKHSGMPGVKVPSDAKWKVLLDGVTVQSGKVTVHATRTTGGGWVIDSGEVCGG
jgi:hypothetical protein